MDQKNKPSSDSASESSSTTNPRLATLAMIESLRHAALCFDSACHQKDCAKMKKVIRHRKHCQRAPLASCDTCKHLMALCCYHSKSCDHQDTTSREEECPVPFCREIKAKLRTSTTSSATNSTRRISHADEIKQRNQQEIQKRLETLYHVCECADADCPLAGCGKLKRLVEHNRDCSGDYFGGPCARCRTLMALCCYHAKHCSTSDTYCPIPNCERIKAKLRQRSSSLESTLLIL